MKINEMRVKTSNEIQNTDILIIQDEDQTKQITVEDLSNYLFRIGFKKCYKRLINDTIDNIIDALNKSKYIIEEDKTYGTLIWIDNDSGAINIALRDESNHYLNIDDIKQLTQVSLNEDNEEVINNPLIFSILIKDRTGIVYKQETSTYEILSYYDEYKDLITVSDKVIPELLNNGAFIRVNFTDLSHNDIYSLKAENIAVKLDSTEEYNYIITNDSFDNTVEYVSEV